MRRWVLQIFGAGAGSLLLLMVLVWLKADKIIAAFALAVAWIGRPIADWIETTWPSKDGGWPKGIATPLVVDAVLVWLLLWLLLIAVLRLPVLSREKKESSNEA
jgi:hypothetical protein